MATPTTIPSDATRPEFRARRRLGAFGSALAWAHFSTVWILAPGSHVLAQDGDVCGRTTSVSDTITTASAAGHCAYVTDRHLREIDSLDLSNQGIVILSAGEFDSLVRIEGK